MSRRESSLRKRVLVAFLTGATLAFAGSPPALAQGDRPKEPIPLARYVPAADLIFYGEFEGLDHHAELWHKSAAFKILTQTTLGALIEDLATQGFEAARNGDDSKPKGAEVVAFIKQVAQSGFAFAVRGKPPQESRIILVFRDGSRPEVRKFVDRLAESMSNQSGKRETLKSGDRTIVQMGQGNDAVAVWIENEDAVLCSASQVGQVTAALTGIDLNVTSHPLYKELKKADAGFQPIGLGFMEMSALPPPPPDVVKVGFDGLKRLDFRIGFKGDALVSVFRVVAPSPRRGILALMDQPKFDLASIVPIPANQTGFTVGSIDLVKTYDQIVALTKLTDPAAANQLGALETNLNQMLGVNLRNDVLAHLGPQWAVDMRPVDRPAGTPSIPFVDWTITIQVDDAKALAKSFDPLMTGINRQLAQLNLNAGPAGPLTFQFQKAKGPRLAYSLDLPPRLFPPGPMSDLKPTLIVDKNELVIAGRSESAEGAMALAGKSEGRWKPTGAFIPLARELPPGLIFLNVNDPRETFPTLVASLPMMLEQMKAVAAGAAARAGGGAAGRQAREIPIRINPDLLPAGDDLARLLFPGSYAMAVDDQGIRFVTRDSLPTTVSPAVGGMAVGLLLPAVQAAREAARRTQCFNNVKQLGLAFHSYENMHGTLPKAALTDKQGKPLLSWRVAVLPYLDQQALYEKFKLDEPWDSPHNRELLSAMPALFACPSAPRKNPASTTNYRVFVGPGTAFETKRGVKLSEFKDGTSRTLAVVESKEAVPWTKPDELEFNPNRPTPFFGAGSNHAGGFNAVFVDGTVQYLKLTIEPEVIQALITRDGREAIPGDSY